jgi:hypothetical protein
MISSPSLSCSMQGKTASRFWGIVPLLKTAKPHCTQKANKKQILFSLLIRLVLPFLAGSAVLSLIVFVKSATSLTAQPPSRYMLLQQWTSPVFWVAQAFLQHVQDIHTDIQSNKIG